MKRITKIIVVAGTSLCLFGVGLFTVGYAFGGSSEIQRAQLNHTVKKVLNVRGILSREEGDAVFTAFSDNSRVVSREDDAVSSDGNSDRDNSPAAIREDNAVSSDENSGSDNSSAVSKADGSDGAGASGTKGKANKQSANSAGYYTYKLDDKRLSSIHTITADLKHIDFTIKKSKDNDCHLSYHFNCKSNKNPLTYQVKDGILTLKESKGKLSSYYASWSNLKKKNVVYNYYNQVTLSVPFKTVLKDSTLKMGEGDLNINGLHSKKAQIELEDGDIFLRKISIAGGMVTTKEGDIDAANFSVPGTVEFNAVNGDISAAGLKVSGNLLLNSEEGDIGTSGLQVSGKAQVKTSYGDVAASGLNLNGQMEISTEDGDVDFSGTAVSGTLLADTEFGDIAASALDLSGKAQFNSKDGNVSLQLKKGKVSRMAITLDTTDGGMMVNKAFGGKKKRKGDGWYYTKTASSGGISLKAVTEWGDISLQ